jgi:hypothetical protein
VRVEHTVGSQLLFAEAAVYVRDLTQIDSIPREQLLKFATIMHDVYRAYDLVVHLLEAQDRRFGGGLVERYVRSLKAGRARLSCGGGM